MSFHCAMLKMRCHLHNLTHECLQPDIRWRMTFGGLDNFWQYKKKWHQLIQRINNLSNTKNSHDGRLDRSSVKYQVGVLGTLNFRPLKKGDPAAQPELKESWLVTMSNDLQMTWTQLYKTAYQRRFLVGKLLTLPDLTISAMFPMLPQCDTIPHNQLKTTHNSSVCLQLGHRLALFSVFCRHMVRCILSTTVKPVLAATSWKQPPA